MVSEKGKNLQLSSRRERLTVELVHCAATGVVRRWPLPIVRGGRQQKGMEGQLRRKGEGCEILNFLISSQIYAMRKNNGQVCL